MCCIPENDLSYLSEKDLTDLAESAVKTCNISALVLIRKFQKESETRKLDKQNEQNSSLFPLQDA